jgi:2-dehydro-3-deoxyphosphogluconate aldolase/(4S)-4-hydroxy-2-oxoglutarate aldolase
MAEGTREILEREGLIPVLRAGSVETAHALVDAMAAGGVTIVEVTMTVPNALTLLRDLKHRYGSSILLGSGTVTDAAKPGRSLS